MTIALVLAGLAAAFVIGFLLGDRRAVKNFNAEIDRRNGELEKLILDREFSVPEPAEREEAVTQPTIH